MFFILKYLFVVLRAEAYAEKSEFGNILNA